MARIKIKSDTTKANKSPIEQLQAQYRTFKKANPERYARVPREIKLLAKSLVDSGMSAHGLAQKLDLAAPSIWSWLKSLETEERANHKPSARTHSPKAKPKPKPTEEKTPLAGNLEKLKSEYGRIAFSESAKSPESQWRLGALAKDLIDQGATIEDLTAVTGAHPLTVRSWLKSLQRKPDSEDLGAESELPPEVAVAEEPSSELKLEQPTPKAAVNTLVEASASPTPTENNSPNAWVKIRVSGHVMEIDWNDLVGRLPQLNKSIAPTEEPIQAPEGSLDFNKAIIRDSDFTEIVSEFEKALIKNALDRHKSIGQCSKALNMPRSTLDAKRRKYGFI